MEMDLYNFLKPFSESLSLTVQIQKEILNI